MDWISWGHFDGGGTRGKAVLIVRTLHGRHREPFPVKKAVTYSARFCIYYLKNFPGLIYPRTPQKRSRCLDPDTNFRLARQRSHCSDFTKRPLDQSCALTNWWSAAALGGLMTGGGGVDGVRPDERALKQRTRWTGVFFLVLQGSATSPVISAGPLASKS